MSAVCGFGPPSLASDASRLIGSWMLAVLPSRFWCTAKTCTEGAHNWWSSVTWHDGARWQRAAVERWT